MVQSLGCTWVHPIRKITKLRLGEVFCPHLKIVLVSADLGDNCHSGTDEQFTKWFHQFRISCPISKLGFMILTLSL